MKKSLNILLIAAALAVITNVQGQNVINAGGVDVKANAGSASISLGQVILHTYESRTGTATSGIQFTLSEVGESESIRLAPNVEVKSFPNPVTNFIQVHASSTDSKNLTISLYNEAGQSIMPQVEFKEKFQVDVQNFPKGIYFVVVQESGKVVYSGKHLVQ